MMSVFFMKSFSRFLHIFHLRVVDRRDGHLAPRRTSSTPAPRELGAATGILAATMPLAEEVTPSDLAQPRAHVLRIVL